jgi:hypothetical protein
MWGDKMDVIELLEEPKSILKLNIQKIVASTSSLLQGEFFITNDGKGTLRGGISVRNSAIEFLSDTFEGNRVKIGYVIDVNKLKIGFTVKTEALIYSNGGEFVLPILINVIAPMLETGLEINISKLNDILLIAKKRNKEAQMLFYRNDFVSWLININYEYLMIYDYIVKDSNKERGLDNFLIFNKLKNKVELTTATQEVYLNIKNDSKETVSGIIKVNKSCWGYVECDVEIKNNSKWITLETNKITSMNFNDDGSFLLKYSIDTSQIYSNIAFEQIIIGDDLVIDLKIKRKKNVYLNLSKENYSFDDKGVVSIDNFTNESIKVEIIPKDSFIKFDSKIYTVEDNKQIEFTVKPNPLQMAQISIIKHSLIESSLYFKITIKSKVIEKILRFTIGEIQ